MITDRQILSSLPSAVIDDIGMSSAAAMAMSQRQYLSPEGLQELVEKLIREARAGDLGPMQPHHKTRLYCALWRWCLNQCEGHEVPR